MFFLFSPFILRFEKSSDKKQLNFQPSPPSPQVKRASADHTLVGAWIFLRRNNVETKLTRFQQFFKLSTLKTLPMYFSHGFFSGLFSGFKLLITYVNRSRRLLFFLFSFHPSTAGVAFNLNFWVENVSWSSNVKFHEKSDGNLKNGYDGYTTKT